MQHVRTLGILIALLFASPAADAASILGSVRHKQTDAPLVGTNIRVQGLGDGTQTDADGQYRIDGLDARNYILILSHIGYQESEQRVDLSGGHAYLVTRLSPILFPGQEITVTATRATERETPVTFSNLGEKELQDRFHTQGIPTMLSELPSTTTYSEAGNNVGYTYLTLRGFDQRRVSVMVNGVPQNDPEDHNVYWVNFPDLASSLEDVQVQRGAGSAFYGPAAIGGSINLVTDRFSPDPRITITSGYGNYDTRKIGFTLNSGILKNKWALYAHVAKTQTDGYRNGAWADFFSYFLGSARYTENTTTRFHFYGSINRDHLNFYGTTRLQTLNGQQVNALRDRDLRRINPITGDEEIEDFHQPHYELLHEWAISPETTLNNTFFYVQGGGFFDFDGSWADTTYYRLTTANGFSATENPGQSVIRAFVNNRHGGWLPRLKIRSAKTETEIGLEARYHQSIHWGKIRWAENLPAEVFPEFRFYEYKGGKGIFSAYANHNQHFAEQWNLMTSLQLTHKRYRLFDESFVGNDFTVPFTFLNPKVGLNYNVTDRLNTYVSLSRTSREPRLVNFYDAASSSFGVQPEFETTTNGTINFDEPLAKPERLNDLELGTAFTGSRLRGSVNVFWMDFQDEIVKNGQLDQFGQPITGNAESTRHKGVEISAAFRLSDTFTVNGNLSMSRNKFRNYTVFDSGTPVSYDGNRIAGFPDV
ncbi:MAG: TonB-dependent receptor, partial [Candidatus Latescibacterota bacterium]|nr:TonB-dependent receptor [Candidatus Latescibacterota bacterium]